jgi:hypothetical protein
MTTDRLESLVEIVSAGGRRAPMNWDRLVVSKAAWRVSALPYGTHFFSKSFSQFGIPSA